MLDDLKKLLGIEDDSLDPKLELILESVHGRLKLLLGGIEVPEEMNHIVVEVAVIRFNRLGSEGMSSHNVEGENMSYIKKILCWKKKGMPVLQILARIQ